MSASTREAWLVSPLRTPIGRFGGGLATVRPDDLLAHVFRAIVERSGVDPAAFDDVIAGCANQAGEDNRNVARMAGLLAGLPQSVPGVTVNRLCASSLEAVNMAARAIWSASWTCCWWVEWRPCPERPTAWRATPRDFRPLET